MRSFLLGIVVLVACERADFVALPPPAFTLPASPESIAIGVAPVQFAPHESRPIDPALLVPARPHRVTSALRWFRGLSLQQRDEVRAYCAFGVKNPCFRTMVMDDDEVDPRDRMLLNVAVDQRRIADQYCDLKHRIECSTPLVVALDDQPVAFTTSTFAFDGEPVATAWPTAATPWIALDRDGDGAITSARELFGDATGARNGFEALAELDANSDGVIDRADPMFARLLLWADRNADGASSPAELRPLADDVMSIALAYHRDVRCVDGSCEGERGTLLRVDGKRGAVIDVYLRHR